MEQKVKQLTNSPIKIREREEEVRKLFKDIFKAIENMNIDREIEEKWMSPLKERFFSVMGETIITVDYDYDKDYDPEEEDEDM